MIGSKFVDHFHNNDTVFCSTFFQNPTNDQSGVFLDIQNKRNVEKIFEEIQPDVVIHASAISTIDKCEIDREMAYSVNIKGTENVLKACENNSVKIVYLSTNAVFDGTKNEYFEDDQTNPINYYGKTKLIGEQKIQNSKCDYLILRTDQPYCWIEKWHRVNSVIRLLNKFSENKSHNEIIDWYNKPTFVPNFVENTMKLIDIKETGIFHVVGSDFISRLDWSMILCDVFGLDKSKVIQISSEDLKLPAKRSNVNLNNEKVTKKTGIPMIGVKQGAQLMFNERY